MRLLNPIVRQKISSLISRPWFFPLLICVLVNGFGILLTFLFQQANWQSPYLAVEYDKHHAIMSVVGSSLMTLIGVSFSISMLILSSLSSQFGPRLLPNVLHSRITQVTLGLFLATFIFSVFCLYINSSVHSQAVQSIYVLILAIVCIIVLVLFVNYVMDSIQIDYILSMVKDNTKEAIRENYQTNEMLEYPETNQHALTQPTHLICTAVSGYIQAIDYDLIARLAEKYQCLVEIIVRPGDFVINGNHILTVYVSNNSEDKRDGDTKSSSFDRSDAQGQMFLSCFRIGQSRTLNQDMEFGYEQISEIAVRALSPGINDPYTARHCLWILADLLCYVDRFHLDTVNLYCGAKWVGKMRAFTYEGIVNASISRIRQAATRDVTVMLACYDMIVKLVPLLKKRQLMRPLIEQAKAVTELLDSAEWTNLDQAAISERQTTLKKLSQRFSLGNID